MDSFFELLIIFLFLLPFLRQGKKKRKQQEKRKKQKQRNQRSGHARREQRERVPAGGAPEQEYGGAGASAGRSGSRAGAGGASGREGDPAAEMIPDNLWTVLTGERRPGSSTPDDSSSGWTPTPSPEPEPAEREPAASGSGGASREPDGAARGDAGGWDRWMDDKAQSLETVPEPDYPDVVSLERPLPSSDLRHERFHEKLDRLKVTAPPPARRRRRRPGLRRLGLAGRSALQRAIVLRDVLSKPKGLEF